MRLSFYDITSAQHNFFWFCIFLPYELYSNSQGSNNSIGLTKKFDLHFVSLSVLPNYHTYLAEPIGLMKAQTHRYEYVQNNFKEICLTFRF